nr:T9SS type A sorting domain-containing protein [Bacteroidia bacterium]
GSNYGFMLRLANETAYKKMIFASSDHVTPAMRPKLDITYTTPLPVSLLSFSIKTTTTGHELNWSTATEINNAGFEIERSESGSVDFEKIGFIQGHGNSSQVNHYSFSDKELQSNINYLYRLKQIDFDGRFSYSKILKSKNALLNREIIAGPNPFKETSTIYYTLEESSHVRIDVYNSMGLFISTITNSIRQEGSHEIIFDPKTSGYSSGVYELRIQINDDLVTKRLVCTL